MSSLDPRDDAALYLKDHAKNGSVGLVKDPWFWSVSLIPDAGMNRGQLGTIFSEVEASEHPKVIRYLPADAGAKQDWDVRLITDSKPDYIAFTSFEASDEERLSGLAESDPTLLDQVKPYREFMTRLQQDYDQATGFGLGGPVVHDMMYIRPLVWVWKRKGLH
jgi:hypothetical protein